MNHLPSVFKAWVRSLTCVPAAYCAFLHASRSAVTVTRSFDCRLPRCPSSRVSSTGPAESAWAQGIHIVAGVSCIICEYPLTLICSLFYRWRGGKKNLILHLDPNLKGRHLYLRSVWVLGRGRRCLGKWRVSEVKMWFAAGRPCGALFLMPISNLILWM